MNKFLFLLVSLNSFAQVGINTDNPKATLQIDALNQSTPESTAGFSVPIYKEFPTTNPTSQQNGMLIYLDNSNSSYMEGFNFWNASDNNWEYIVDFSSQGLDLSKTQVIGTQFAGSNISGAGEQSRFVSFTSINTIDPSFTLSNGGLKIGETATYFLQLTGGVFKATENQVNDYKVEILVNGNSSAQLTSTNSAPGGTDLGRSTLFYISSVVSFNKGDVLTVKLTRSTIGANTVSVETPFNLTINKLD